MAQNTSRIIVGLDIGTNKVAVIVGELIDLLDNLDRNSKENL